MGLGAADHQLLACPGHRHIEAVQLLARLRRHLEIPGGLQRRRHRSRAAHESHTLRRPLLRRPVHQQLRAMAGARRRVGVEHHHGTRFQAFGAVHGEQLHGVLGRGRVGAQASGAKVAHKTVQRGKTGAAVLERGRLHRIDAVQRAQAPRLGHGRGHAGDGIGIGHDAVQQIVRRQPLRLRQPTREELTRAPKRDRQLLVGTAKQGRQPARGVLRARHGCRAAAAGHAPCQPQQIVVGSAKERAAQRACKCQVVAR